MTTRLVIIALLLGVFFSANAQEGTSSPYSFYGTGLTKFRGTAEQRGMAGLSVFSDSIHLNLQNPAGFGKLGLTAYTAGVSHQSLTLKNSTTTEENSNTTFDYLALGFAAGEKLSFGLSVRPATAVGYNIVRLSEEGEENPRRDQFSGSGGLNKVALTTAYNITKDLSVGLDLQYNFGNIQNKSIRFQQGVQFGTREINRSDFLGFSYKLGAHYQKSVGKNYQFTASAFYIPSSDINVENFREISSIILGADGREVVVESQEIPQDDTNFDNPSGYNVGVGFGKPRQWFVGLEYSNAEKSNFNNRSFSNSDVRFQDASKFKLGGFYIPKFNDITSYFNRIVFRAGARYEETGLNIRGEDINEFGISFGVGLPTGRQFSNANLSFEYGQRGTTAQNLVQETFFNFIIGLSLNDKWFQKRKFN